jgi:hypothetical protein
MCIRSSSARLLPGSMRSSSAVALLLAATVLVQPSRAEAQGGNTRALAPIPVTDVSCRFGAVNAKGKPKKNGANAVTLVGKYPPRTFTIDLDAANRVVDFHSVVNWPNPSPGSESVDVFYSPAGAILKGSRTMRTGGAKQPAITPLTGDDNEMVVQMVRAVLAKCKN